MGALGPDMGILGHPGTPPGHALEPTLATLGAPRTALAAGRVPVRPAPGVA